VAVVFEADSIFGQLGAQAMLKPHFCAHTCAGVLFVKLCLAEGVAVVFEADSIFGQLGAQAMLKPHFCAHTCAGVLFVANGTDLPGL
jgi:hypothetical protein